MTRRQLIFIALVPALLAGSHGAAGAAEPVRITEPVQATEFDLAPVRTYGTPGFAVDPESSLNVVASAVELRENRCGLMRSRDGGQTWAQIDTSPSPPEYPFCLQTNSHTIQGKLAFGRDQTLYYALGGWDSTDGANRSVLLARSTDFGDTWRTTLVADARGRTEEDVQPNRPITSLVVDASSGDEDIVYIAWRQQNRVEDPGLANQAVVATSTDGGESFSEPVNLAAGVFEEASVRDEALKTTTTTTPLPTTTSTVAPGAAELPALAAPEEEPEPEPDPNAVVNFGGSNPELALADDGTLYAVWVSNYDNLEPTPDVAHFLSRSTDQGKTFTVTEVNPFSRENVNTFGSMQMAWAPGGGSDGTLHLVYEGSKRPEVQNQADVFYRRSTDGGESWSDVQVVNDDPPDNLYYSGLPNIGVAPNGRIDVAWFDTRDDPGIVVNDVYYAFSTDNGISWSKNMRVTDRSINRKIGPYAQNFDLNGPPGLLSSNAYTLVGWDDTRNGDAVAETQDIYTAAVQFDEIETGTSNAARYALAGAIGLLVVGFALSGFAIGRRRKAGSSEATA